MTVDDAKEWFRIYYAQNREDLLLKSFFPELTNGFYVDVGAHDPVVMSVTKLLYDEGWSGLNIEPQKAYYSKLKQQRTRDINLCLALGSKPGRLKLRQYPEASGLSTISEEMKNDYLTDITYKGVTTKFSESEVRVDTLSNVLAKYVKNNPIHVLKIDVEGFEKEVLNGNDWAKYRPMVLCIESNHMVEDWRDVIEKAKYSKVLFDGLNDYYIADEHREKLMQNFNYVKIALSRVPVHNVPFELFASEIDKMSKELKKLNGIIIKQDALLSYINEHLSKHKLTTGELVDVLNSKSYKAARSAGLIRNKLKKLIR